MDKKVPVVRFKGFTDDWEQVQLSTLVSFVNGRAFKQSELLKDGKYKVARVGNFNTNSQWYYSNLELPTDKYILKGDLVYLWATNFGPEIWTGSKAIYHYHIWKLKFDNDVIPKEYLYHWLDLDKTKVLSDTNGTTMIHITKGNMEERQLEKPIQYEEEIKIGKILNKVDSLIDLYQLQTDILTQLKQSLLQNLFVEDGNKTPKIRFSGLRDDWKQFKLGNLANIVRGSSPRPISDQRWFDSTSDIGWLRISDVTRQNGRIHSLEQHLSLEGIKKTRVLRSPHLLLSIAASYGKPVINYVNTGVHDGFLIFINPEFDINFLYYWLEMFKNQWKKYGQPGSQVNLNSEIVRNQSILLPSRNEQHIIASMIQLVEKTITLNQEQLKLHETLKKMLLQKLFV